MCCFRIWTAGRGRWSRSIILQRGNIKTPLPRFQSSRTRRSIDRGVHAATHNRSIRSVPCSPGTLRGSNRTFEDLYNFWWRGIYFLTFGMLLNLECAFELLSRKSRTNNTYICRPTRFSIGAYQCRVSRPTLTELCPSYSYRGAHACSKQIMMAFELLYLIYPAQDHCSHLALLPGLSNFCSSSARVELLWNVCRPWLLMLTQKPSLGSRMCPPAKLARNSPNTNRNRGSQAGGTRLKWISFWVHGSIPWDARAEGITDNSR